MAVPVYLHIFIHLYLCMYICMISTPCQAEWMEKHDADDDVFTNTEALDSRFQQKLAVVKASGAAALSQLLSGPRNGGA